MGESHRFSKILPLAGFFSQNNVNQKMKINVKNAEIYKMLSSSVYIAQPKICLNSLTLKSIQLPCSQCQGDNFSVRRRMCGPHIQGADGFQVLFTKHVFNLGGQDSGSTLTVSDTLFLLTHSTTPLLWLQRFCSQNCSTTVLNDIQIEMMNSLQTTQIQVSSGLRWACVGQK